MAADTYVDATPGTPEAHIFDDPAASPNSGHASGSAKRFDLAPLWRALDQEERDILGMAAIAAEFAVHDYGGSLEHQRAMRAAGESAASLVSSMVRDIINPDERRAPDLAPLGLSQCRRCGCTDAFSCDEGCFWIDPSLCSACEDSHGDVE